MVVGSNTFRLGIVASAVVLVLAGCGGGSSSSVSETASGSSVQSASLRGQSYKGPIAGGTVCAYVIDNAAVDRKGALVQAQAGSTASVADGCVVTANDGTFTLVLPADASGDLLVESTGGTYCSDESVFNGTSCAGGGTPIAMAAAKLRSVIATPASGVVADAPLTLLTTAAAGSSGALSAGSFGTAYATIAGNFGLGETTPSTSPATGALQTVLASLATYLGADTSLVDGVVAGIAGSSIAAGSGGLSAPAEFACSPLETTDLQYMGTIMTYMPPPIPGLPPVYMPTPYTFQSYGFGGSCTNSADGVSSIDTAYTGAALGNLLTGTEITGTYQEIRYTGRCGESRTYQSSGYTSMTMQSMGTQAIARSASADPLKAQEGTASRLRITLAAGGTLGLAQPTTHNHLFSAVPRPPLRRP